MMGIGASPGIAMGKVFMKADNITINREPIEDVPLEVIRLEDALHLTKTQVEKLMEITRNEVGEKESQIFEAHLLMIDDPEFIQSVIDNIKNKKVNAEWSVKETLNSFVEIFRNLDSDYIKERIADLQDVSMRIIRNLLGIKDHGLQNIEGQVIIVARDMTPSDTAIMPKEKVLGFITEVGGSTSHTAIMARTMGIPAIVGAGDLMKCLKNGDFIAMDGFTGQFSINPSMEVLKNYKLNKERFEKEKKGDKDFQGRLTITRDGWKTGLGCNIGSPEHLKYVLENDAEGIGLYRTEFLYMNREIPPNENEQFNAYKKVVEAMDGKPVVIRTLDVGGDKQIPYLNIAKEENPFLGFRAIRYCLENRELFKTQLCALLRASAFGTLHIMFPMISNIQEIKEAKNILQEAKIELEKKTEDYDKNIKIGIMIEIPAAAIISDILAKEVDFFSIGTNDLIQYTMAVDRTNEKISDLYSPYHPALLRLIKMVIDNGHGENIWVGMCGEASSNKSLVPILVGMGLDEFSMNPSSILGIRKLIYKLSKRDMEKHVNMVLKLPDGNAVLEYINKNISL